MEQITIDTAQTIAIMVSFIIPLAVGLLSKLRAPSWLKSSLNLGLTGLTSMLAEANTDEFQLSAFMVLFALTWANSVASYYGFLKPSGISKQVQVKTASFGIAA